MQDHESFLRQLIAEKAEVAADFSRGATFAEDLDVDSILLLEIIVAIEKHYEIKFAEERYRDFQSLDSALSMLQEALSTKA